MRTITGFNDGRSWYAFFTLLLWVVDDPAQLAEYQEQAYLLDPYLEELVTPVVDAFKEFVKGMVDKPNREYSKLRAEHITMMLYEYVKFRGQKAISTWAVLVFHQL